MASERRFDDRCVFRVLVEDGHTVLHGLDLFSRHFSSGEFSPFHVSVRRTRAYCFRLVISYGYVHNQGSCAIRGMAILKQVEVS